MAFTEDGVVEMETTLMLAHDQAPASVVNAPLVTQEIRYHMPEAGEGPRGRRLRGQGTGTFRRDD